MLRLFKLLSFCFICFSSFAQAPPRDPDFTGRYNDVISLPGNKFIAVGFLTISYLGEENGGTVIYSNIPGFSTGNNVPKDIDRALAQQTNGKILITGTGGTVRLNTDGSLDDSFTNNGLGGGDIKVNCEGKIFVANASYITQLNADGSIDKGFANGGSVNTGFQINYLLLQPDGKIIAVGANNLARYEVNGSLDYSFQPTVPFGVTNFGEPALQGDGKIVVPGLSSLSPFTSSISLLRLNTDGSTDSSFSYDGTAVSNVGGWAIGAVVQDDGRIVVGFGISAASPIWVVYYYGLVRFNTNGTQDANFMNSNMGVYFSPFVIKPHAIGMGINEIYVGAEHITYPGDKRQPVQEFPYLGIHATDGQKLVLRPSLKAPTDVTVSNDEGACSASHVQLGTPNTTGTCVQLITNDAPGIFPKGTTTVTWTVTDINGNTNTAMQRVTVVDVEKPKLEAPTAKMFCNGPGVYTIPKPSYSDNCEISEVSYSITGATERSGIGDDASGSFNTGSSTITWNVKDRNGNQATATTVINVSQPFTVTIPDTYSLKAGTNANTVYIGYAPASATTLTVMATGNDLYSYNWSTGETTSSITVSPASTSTFKVTVTNALGCAIQASKTINVIDVRCGNKNDKVMVCKVAPGNGKTNNNCVSANAVEALLKDGSYLGICSGSSPGLATRSKMQPQNTADDNFSLSVSSNPSFNQFALVANSTKVLEKVYMKVYGSDGKLIESKTIAVNQRIEFGSRYHAGVYIVEVQQGSEKRIIKLVKIK